MAYGLSNGHVTDDCQRLMQTSERARFGAFWTFCALLCELDSRA